MRQEKVGIVGGGVAGIARAILECEAGALVTILERNNRLGGRAASFYDSPSGTMLDYCAHVWMKSCTAFEQFARKIQILPYWQENRPLFFEQFGPQNRLDFAESARPRFHTFDEKPWLPGLLRFAPALARWTSLTISEKAFLARQLLCMKRIKSFQGSVGAWLQAQSTPENLIRQFWDPVVVSALSCSLEEASLYYAHKVCYESFLSQRGGNRFWTSNAALGTMFGTDLEERLERLGIEILTRMPIARLLTDSGCCVGIETSSGQKRFFDRTVLAVDLTAARKLVPELVKQTSAYTPRAISTAHVWTDRPIIDRPYGIFPGRLIQWIIASRPAEPMSEISGEWTGYSTGYSKDSADQSWYSQIIVSGSDGWLNRRCDFERQLREEIFELQPGIAIGRLKPVHCQKATFVPSEAFERQRKNLVCPLERLTIIGDWTDTDWPATMESAVRSAIRKSKP